MAIARRCDRCLNFYNEIVYNHPDAKIEVSTNITDALGTEPNRFSHYSVGMTYDLCRDCYEKFKRFMLGEGIESE